MIISPELLINAYSHGIFPMADSREGEINWYKPDNRAIFDIYKTKISRSVKQLIRKNVYKVDVDKNFRQVVIQCAGRDETWINDEIIDTYTTMQELGFAHSVEVYNKEKLVGGLYGVHLGGAFFGESMFNLEPNTSKIAFAYLLEILKYNNFSLLDSQFLNPFTKQLGAFEIDDRKYMFLLNTSIQRKCGFYKPKIFEI
ncbi:MAG: leucyl/phenylalanyl-tRNA--protein transferase [Ignavibacteria bacterium GWF2_33_9]|nr:MAG: leucyl/phenylalanyl-tRNA--protein transferase [Ignavibacteria bacterium GWF2_33_9]